MTSGERVFAPAYEPKDNNIDNILSSDNMLIKWAATKAVKQYFKFIDCIFQIG